MSIGVHFVEQQGALGVFCLPQIPMGGAGWTGLVILFRLPDLIVGCPGSKVRKIQGSMRGEVRQERALLQISLEVPFTEMGKPERGIDWGRGKGREKKEEFSLGESKTPFKSSKWKHRVGS